MTQEAIQIVSQGKPGRRYETPYTEVPGDNINEAVEFQREFLFKKKKKSH